MCFTASDVLLFDIKQLRPGLMLKTSLQSICILIDGLLCTPSTRQSSTMFVVLEQALQVLQACFAKKDVLPDYKWITVQVSGWDLQPVCYSVCKVNFVKRDTAQPSGPCSTQA